MPSLRHAFPEFAFGGYKVDPVGEILNGGVITSGNVYWVKDPSDADYVSFKDRVGNANLFDTIQGAIDQTTSDENDYIFVAPKIDGGVWDIGTALDINEDRVHLISLGYSPTNYGYANTLRGFSSAALDTEIINITGNAVEVAGFRFLGTHGTTDDGTIEAVMKVTGSQVHVHDCVVESNVAAAASDGTVAHISGDGFRADNVWFGNAVGIGAVKVNNSVVRPEFHDCTFVIDAQATTDELILAGTGASQYVLIANSQFINVENGTAPASAVTGSVTVDNPWILHNNSYINITDAGTDPGVFVSPVHSGTAAAAFNSGIAVGTALGVAA